MIFLFRGWKRVFSRVFFSNRPFESLSPLLLSGARLLAFLSNKRILQLRSSFSGQEEGGGRNGCCSATKAVIARTFVLLSEGCRRRRDTGASPRLASSPLASSRPPTSSSFAQKRPHCFSWRKQCISCISRLAFKGGGWKKRKERRGEEEEKRWRGEGERERRKKSSWRGRGTRAHGLVHTVRG